MNLTIMTILVLFFSLNSMAEELLLEPKGAPVAAPAEKMSVPSETLMRLMEERQQDLDRREAAVRREEERLKLLRVDIEGLLKTQEKPSRRAAFAVKPTTITTFVLIRRVSTLSSSTRGVMIMSCPRGLARSLTLGRHICWQL